MVNGGKAISKAKISSTFFNAKVVAPFSPAGVAKLDMYSHVSDAHSDAETFSGRTPVASRHSSTYFNTRVNSKVFMQQRSYSSRVETTRVPDFSHYKKTGGSVKDKEGYGLTDGRAFTYMMIGSAGTLGAVSAKNFVANFLSQLAPSADVLALAKAEVDVSAIPEGKNVTIKWRGKPVFIRHRTSEEIDEANAVQLSELRDPQADSERIKKPEWLVIVGICTHLGCVPIGEAGDWKAWYCPCHGSHYDISGRIRKGPAPLNLAVPPYEFTEDGDKVIIG